MTDTGVRFEIKENVAWITIDRPKRSNALSATALVALIGYLRDTTQSPKVRALVLTGAGERAFCSGGDLQDMGGATTLSAGQTPPFAQLLGLLHRFPLPILGRINGDALGGGLGLAFSCDISVAAQHAGFGTPEIHVGLFPWMILPILATQLAPKQLAELTLSGRKLSAQEALDWRLINQVVPKEDLDGACKAWLDQLCGACPTVLAQALPNLRAQRARGLPAILAEQQDRFTWNLDQPEFAEGVAAFLEKRRPSWSSD